jgi:hypothetical protein
MSLLHYQQLNNDSLGWTEFTKLTDKLKEEMSQTFSTDTVPWDAKGVLDGLSAIVLSKRTERSNVWISSLEENLNGLEMMDVSDANRLHGRATVPPSYITEKDEARRLICVQQIESRLNTLKIDWLVEKFRELPEEMQKQFLNLVSNYRSGG